ncbi:unnamed protein product [Brassica oleracea]
MSSTVNLGTRSGAAGYSLSVSDTTFWSSAFDDDLTVILWVLLLQREQVINHCVTVFISSTLIKQTLQDRIHGFSYSFHFLLKTPSEYFQNGKYSPGCLAPLVLVI